MPEVPARSVSFLTRQTVAWDKSAVSPKREPKPAKPSATKPKKDEATDVF
jgi:hypothetical protein